MAGKTMLPPAQDTAQRIKEPDRNTAGEHNVRVREGDLEGRALPTQETIERRTPDQDAERKDQAECNRDDD